MAKKPVKRSLGKSKRKASASAKTKLKPSALKIFDISDDDLIDSPDNPQEMDDATFDELVEGIRADGVDEPLHVINIHDDDGNPTGKYMITSGHHRRKAGKVAGVSDFPCIIKPDMDDAARKVALVRRNQLRGSMNSKKFTKLFLEVAPTLGSETAKRLMGFTKEAAFKKVFEDVSKSLPEGQRKQLTEAKETVTSVDDLSSILNGIFRKEGSKVKRGYMVFSFGGKEHHYFQIDKQLNAVLKEVEDRIEKEDKTAAEVFTELLGSKITTPASKNKTKVKRNGNRKKAA